MNKQSYKFISEIAERQSLEFISDDWKTIVLTDELKIYLTPHQIECLKDELKSLIDYDRIGELLFEKANMGYTRPEISEIQNLAGAEVEIIAIGDRTTIKESGDGWITPFEPEHYIIENIEVKLKPVKIN